MNVEYSEDGLTLISAQDIIGDFVIPDGIKRIETKAFSGCSEMTSVYIPNSVEGIGHFAFENCSSLTFIEFPGGSEEPEWYSDRMFKGCTSLENIYVREPKNKFYESRDGILFLVEDDENKPTIEKFPPAKAVDDLSFLHNIEVIDWGAFEEQQFLTDIELPDSIAIIHPYAFSGCPNLKSVVIPSSVKEINEFAFADCPLLESVHFNRPNTYISYNAFSGCKSLKSIFIPDTIDDISESAFQDCPSLKSVVLPKTLTWLLDSTFWGCAELQSIELHEGLIGIDEDVFAHCWELKSLTLPSTLKHLDLSAFGDCDSLKFIHCKVADPSLLTVKTSLYVDCMDIDGWDVLKDCTLYVPDAAVESYKQNESFRFFKEILPDSLL